jgi:hypothetical protein
MAYKRKYLLDCEIAEAKAKGKWNWKPLTIGLWAAGAALLCVALLYVPVAFRLMTGTKAGPRPIPREEFNRAVVGKDKGELVRAFGPPPRWGGDFMYYRSLTIDSATGKVDEHIMLTIDTKNDRCVKVSFPPAGPD